MSGMTAYFVRRLLLIPFTFVVITFMVYAVLRVVPGGPVEQAQRQLRMQAAGEGGGGLAADKGEVKLTREQIRAIEEYYQVDKPIPVGYGNWLVGLLRGDFGRSTEHAKPVLDVIVEKFPISVYFGLIGYFATWVVCVPLGIVKGLRHRSLFDAGSSFLVFLGYSIPGWVACLVLLVLFGGGSYWNLVPLGDFRSPPEVWESLSVWGRMKDQLHHTIVPVLAYIMGGFATMTILMKNSLLENLGADYVRTAFAKGLSGRRVVFVHALRNSLIPITADIGHALALILAGSFLIESVCNIPGMGLLGYHSILRRDYPVIMGILVFSEVIHLTGNVLSDMVWALIDPRIRFG